MQSEIESFIEAQNLVCEKAKISINVFMATNEAIPSDKQSILDLL